MQIIQARRDFLTGLPAAGAAGVLGSRRALANEGPPPGAIGFAQPTT
jgi:hypothetical protein